jgi:hypothetical protein
MYPLSFLGNINSFFLLAKNVKIRYFNYNTVRYRISPVSECYKDPTECHGEVCHSKNNAEKYVNDGLKCRLRMESYGQSNPYISSDVLRIFIRQILFCVQNNTHHSKKAFLLIENPV